MVLATDAFFDITLGATVPSFIGAYQFPKYVKAESENRALNNQPPEVYSWYNGKAANAILGLGTGIGAWTLAIQAYDNKSLIAGVAAGILFAGRAAYSRHLGSLRRQMESQKKEKDSIHNLEALTSN